MLIVLLGALLAAGMGLLLAPDLGRRWFRARARGESSHPPDDCLERRVPDVPMTLELIAAMLEAGSSVEHSLFVLSQVGDAHSMAGVRAVVGALRLGADWDQAWAAARAAHPAPHLAGLASALNFAATTGAPAASILVAEAQQLRRRQYRAAERRAAALGVRLVVPLGLCFLPAFVCLGILPVLLALLPAIG